MSDRCYEKWIGLHEENGVAAGGVIGTDIKKEYLHNHDQRGHNYD